MKENAGDSSKTMLPATDSIFKIEVPFDDFKVIFPNLAVYDEPKQFVDTVEINVDIGYSFENCLMQIESFNKTNNYEVYLTLEQDLTLTKGENDFEDLLKWKKLINYGRLNDSSGFFHLSKYNLDSLKNQLSKDFKSIKKNVLASKGAYITKGLDTVTTLNNLPVELWISKLIIKIIQTDAKGSKKTKYIINKATYGC
jgi:hypothetical protein